MKPVFRWTMYDTSRLGLELFIESICRTPVSLGTDRFDWVVTYNGSDDMYRTVTNALKIAPVEIKLIRQKAEDCPVPIKGPLLGLWKVTPPRLNLNVPEIICDNDLVLIRSFPKIDEFIETGRPLLIRDPIRFYGNLGHLHADGENWNSGLLTLPPGYDFGADIKDKWESMGGPETVGYAEEQSLLTKIIRGLDPAVVETDEIVELNKDGIPFRPGVAYIPTGSEYGFHFVESNRHYHREAVAFLERSNPPAPIPVY